STYGRALAGILARRPEEILRLPTIAAAERFFSEHPDSCSVLIASPEIADADALRLAEVAQARSPSTAVVLVRKRSSDELFQAAMRAGVRELVDFSVDGEEQLRDAVGRAFGWSAGLRSTRREPVAVEPGSDAIVLSVFASK